MSGFRIASPMGIFTCCVVAVLVVRLAVVPADTLQARPLLGMVFSLFTLLLAVPVLYYSWKLYRFIKTGMLWKISRRLVLAYVFIGAIPVILVISIFYVSAILFYYQLSYFLVFNQIGIHSARVHSFNLSLREELYQFLISSEPHSSYEMIQRLDDSARYLLSSYPSASIIISFPDPASGDMIAYANQRSISRVVDGYKPPGWLESREFSGLVVDDVNREISAGNLFIRSYVVGDFYPDFPFALEVSVPFDNYLLERLKSALGQDLLLAGPPGRSGISVVFPNTHVAPEQVLESTFDTGDVTSKTGWIWEILLFPVSWDTGEEISTADADTLMVEVSIPKLMQNLFDSESILGKFIYEILIVIVVVFLLAEIVSVIIGIMITRRITDAVNNLDLGTRYVKQGDFSRRIVVKSNDQLGELAASFNQMTEYVQQLVKERVQKERLEREIEIAREVQDRLFPDSAPRMNHMEVTGVCLPARTVSGDYYDFLPLGGNELGLAIGDICGKGISAALLMANLQATLRSNVLNLWPQNRQNGERSVARVVERMNSQIYSYTTDNKFATFFYALYDDVKLTMTFCNAGHNPPLYFSGNECRRLKTGGTVVGIFDDSTYEQETIALKTGDLFVAYTDGITESLNEDGEEFGEGRLIQLVDSNRESSVNKIQECIVKTVSDWTFSEERDDDMTLLIAKIV